MKPLTWRRFAQEIFLILREGEDQGILFAPLYGKFFSLQKEGVVLANEYIETGVENEFYQYLEDNGLFSQVQVPSGKKADQDKVTELYLSLTSGCNLACTYCYARAGENPETLEWDKITTAIQKLYSNARNAGENNIEITFHGTGEATLLWKTLVNTVDYAQTNLPDGLEIRFSLVTNGTRIDDSKAKYFAEKGFFLTVSMDGLQKVHDLQRPHWNGQGSFHEVVEGIKNLVEYNVDFVVRSTITGYNQDEMIDFVKLCASLGCRSVSLVPFSESGRGGVNSILSVDPNKFIEDYVALLDRADDLGIAVRTPSDDITDITARFCDGDGNIFALMPGGQISSCTRITREDDQLAGTFFLGEVKDGSILIDPEKIPLVQDLNVHSFPDCDGCFAKYICAGGCHADRLGGGTPTGYCQVTREVIFQNIQREIAEIERR